MLTTRLTKDWVPKDQALLRLRGNLGVFELADAKGEVIYIGFAGGNSQFGLKGVVQEILQSVDAVSVRWEVNTAYLSRFKELMMVHIADHGAAPVNNPPIKLGKLSPS